MDTLDEAAAPGSETGPEGEPGEQPEEEEERRPKHYKTGNLTAAQAAAVDAWRARLRTDKPLPGERRVDPAVRMALGWSDHPKASTSDVLAAAVADMLRRRAARPRPLALAAYAYRARRAARPGVVIPGADPPERPAVSWYAPPGLEDAVENLREQAREAAWEKARGLEKEARARFPGPLDRPGDDDEDPGRRAAGPLAPGAEPGPGQDPVAIGIEVGRAQAAARARAEAEQLDAEKRRAAWIAGQVIKYGLWYAGRDVPPGALARMAIDRWASRPVDDVIADGVRWSKENHDQHHRARRDMRQLGR